MKILIALLLMCSMCWAEDIQLTSDFTLHKPNIDKAKYKLTKTEQDQVEHALKFDGRKLIHKELKPIKNDYQNDFDRGTVEYTPKCRNYSFHKVVIPDGTVIRDSNFTQKEPHSKYLEGKNLHFISCNLSNVEIDPSWIVEDCNTCQIKRVKKSEVDLDSGQKKVIISHQVEDKEGKYNEVCVDEEITNDSDSYNLAILRLNK